MSIWGADGAVGLSSAPPNVYHPALFQWRLCHPRGLPVPTEHGSFLGDLGHHNKLAGTSLLCLRVLEVRSFFPSIMQHLPDTMCGAGEAGTAGSRSQSCCHATPASPLFVLPAPWGEPGAHPVTQGSIWFLPRKRTPTLAKTAWFSPSIKNIFTASHVCGSWVTRPAPSMVGHPSDPGSCL